MTLVLLAVGIVFSGLASSPHKFVYANAGVMALCWILPFWYRWHQGRLDFYEPVNAIGALYLVYFGLGSIWTVNDPHEIAFDPHVVPWIPQAAVYCTLGYLAFLAGYYCPWLRSGRARARDEIPGHAMFLVIPGALGLIGAMAEFLWYRGGKLGISLPALFGSLPQLKPLYVFAWGLGWMLYLSGRATRGQRQVLFYALVPLTALIMLLTMNDKSQFLTLAGVPIIALWYARKKVPWTILISIMLILVFFIFPFYNTWRLLDPRLDEAKRAAMSWEIISDWNFEYYIRRSLGAFKSRMALINSVATVVRDTGRWVPYAKGETLFLPALAFFIPRVFWEDKPLFTLGRDFGVKFRMVNMLDKDTSIASTVPGELYWNFDLPGIVIGLAFGGFLVRFAYRRYGEPEGEHPIRRAIYIVLLIQLLHFGGGIAAESVATFRTMLLLEAYLYLARRTGLTGSLRPVEMAGAPWRM